LIRTFLSFIVLVLGLVFDYDFLYENWKSYTYEERREEKRKEEKRREEERK
jgi:hypothetical protein